MTECDPDNTRKRLRGWIFPVVAVVAWFVVVANCANADAIEVPEFLLAGGGGVPAMNVMPKSAPMNMPAHVPGGPLDGGDLADQMQQDFNDQLVAGVSRPSVELAVHFDFDSDTIHSEAAPSIEAAAKVLNQHFPETEFRVAGYADTAGDEDYNQVLSERRAKAVFDRLVGEFGVEKARLSAVGFGENDPDVDATSEQHRRVELQIVRFSPPEGF